MSFIITSAKITGNPDKGGWAQAYQFTPADPEKLTSRGQFFAVISTGTKEEGIDAVSAGRELLSRVHEEYFGRGEGSAFSTLSSSVEKVIEEFSSWEDVEIGCITYLTDIVYIVVGGGAKVYLLRNDILTPLIQSENGKCLAASGHPHDSDLFIIGSSSFFTSFSAGVIKGSAIGKDPNYAVESLAPTLHALPAAGKVGALFLSFAQGSEVNERIAKIENKIQKVPIPRSSTRGELPPQNENVGTGFFKSLLKRVKETRVYVQADAGFDRESNPKRRISLGLGAALLVLLVVSIVFGIREKKQKDIKENYVETLASASHNLSEADELYSLNPERSRELLIEARQKVLGLSAEGVQDSTLDELKKKIEENEKKILGEFRVEAESFIELALLSDGFEADEVVMSQEVAYVVDKDSRKIIRVGVGNKRSEVIVGPHVIDKIDNIAVYSDRVFVVNSEGVFEIEEGRVDPKIDPEWMGSVLAYSYAANFYILDKGASTIYRYTSTETGFGSKKDWFNEGVTFDVSEARAWVIDGAIWLVTEKGQILKFSLGLPRPFSLTGVFPVVGKSLAIYTDDQLENLYILDNENERVVVVTKDGEYKAQYISSDIRESKGLVVSEKEKKIILLTSDKLLSIEMEHL